MTAWIIEIEKPTPQLLAICTGAYIEVLSMTRKFALCGYGREPLALIGFIPFSFTSDRAVVWVSPTKFACGGSWKLRRECIRLGRQYMRAQYWRLFAEVYPREKLAHTFARVFGFQDRGLLHDRMIMELPKWP